MYLNIIIYYVGIKNPHSAEIRMNDRILLLKMFFYAIIRLNNKNEVKNLIC